MTDIRTQIATLIHDNTTKDITPANMRSALDFLALKNVADIRDFGAKVDGTTDDAAAIEAAIASGVGAVYIPPGITQVSRPVLLGNTGLSAPKIFGAFNDGHFANISNSNIRGNFAGPIFSSLTAVNGPLEICNLAIWNSNASSIGIHFANGSAGVHLHNLYVSAQKGIWLGPNCFSSHVSDVFFRPALGAIPDGSASGTLVAGSIGLQSEGNSLLNDCDFNGFDEAIRVGGTGVDVFSCRMEVCNTGINIGVDEDGASFSWQGVILGCQTEACGTGYYVQAANGSLISGNGAFGSVNAPGGESHYGLRLGNGVSGCVISACGLVGRFSVAAISLPSGVIVTLQQVNGSNAIGPVWVQPTERWFNGNVLVLENCDNPKTYLNTYPSDHNLVNSDLFNYSDGVIVEINDTNPRIANVRGSGYAYPDNAIFKVRQIGSGAVTIISDPGVNLRTARSLTLSQWDQVTIERRSANDWVVY